MTTCAAAGVTKRQRNPIERRHIEREPDELHDYYPDKRIDHDECSVCGREYEDPLHIPVTVDESDE